MLDPTSACTRLRQACCPLRRTVPPNAIRLRAVDPGRRRDVVCKAEVPAPAGKRLGPRKAAARDAAPRVDVPVAIVLREGAAETPTPVAEESELLGVVVPWGPRRVERGGIGRTAAPRTPPPRRTPRAAASPGLDTASSAPTATRPRPALARGGRPPRARVGRLDEGPPGVTADSGEGIACASWALVGRSVDSCTACSAVKSSGTALSQSSCDCESSDSAVGEIAIGAGASAWSGEVSTLASVRSKDIPAGLSPKATAGGADSRSLAESSAGTKSSSTLRVSSLSAAAAAGASRALLVSAISNAPREARSHPGCGEPGIDTLDPGTAECKAVSPT